MVNKRTTIVALVTAALMLASEGHAADWQRQRAGHGVQDSRDETQPDIDPNAIAPPGPEIKRESIPVPDRWRLLDTLGVIKEHWYDPYNQNTLKGDKPIHDDWFLNLSLISDSVIEPRRIPTPVGPATTNTPGSIDVIGKGEQLILNQNFIFSAAYYKGDTIFRPPDYEYRLTLVANANYVRSDELRALYIDPRNGDSRQDTHLGVQDFYVDKHLRNVSERFDFDSLRVGIQPFTVDFRGFLFNDNPFGVRIFGTRANNVYQYNLAWFRRIEKDTNSGLNDIAKPLRDDDVFVANLYRQDFPVPGFTSQIALVHNINRESEKSYYDNNGFLIRPASIGTEQLREYQVSYLGYNGDGHFGRNDVSVSTYYAGGSEDRATFSGKASDISAFFAAAEFARDYDWIRTRFSLVYGSGDKDPYDDKSTGFDAILENPLIAGADTSFWIRQPVANIGGGGVALSGRNGVLNSMRSSKDEGQSNFTNPGVRLIGVGADFDITPQTRITTNINHLWFDTTEVLEVARNQGNIDRDIGWDVSVASIYRPYFSQNIVLRLSAAVLIPGKGYEQMFGDQLNYSVLGNFVFSY
jgi:hypothetical protein